MGADLSDPDDFTIVRNFRDRIIEFGYHHWAQDYLDDFLIYLGLPASNGVLFSMNDVNAPDPERETVRVYVLWRSHPTPIAKVGVSNDPQTRCRGLSNARSEELTVWCSTRVYTRQRAIRIERAAHSLLTDFEVGNEWFACPPDIAWRAVLEAGGESEEVL